MLHVSHKAVIINLFYILQCEADSTTHQNMLHNTLGIHTIL
jgi:hypothetical protein